MAGLWEVVAAGRFRETAALLQRNEEEAQKELHRIDMNGNTLLLLGVHSSNPDIVQLLLERGSQPDARNRKTGCGPLHEAVRLVGVDALRIIELLVEHGAYVNLRDKEGRTPLHIATENAFGEAIDYLLSVGGNPTFKDKKGRKPGHIAKTLPDHHIYEAFFNVEHKAVKQETRQPPNRKKGVRRKKDPSRRLFNAILLNRLRDLEALLKGGEKAGVRVNSTSHNGHSPLYLASKLGRLEALQLLIKYGAKPHIMNTSGTTPLHAAAEGGHDAVVEVLLNHRAPIDVRDNDKKTPLDVAFQKGRGSTIRLLLNLLLVKGQTFSQKRWDWMFRKATKNGHVDLMQLVLKCSPSLNVNVQTLSGWSPLHIAVRHGQVDAVAFLLSQRGIKTNLGTNDNWTPLHVACDYAHTERRMKLMSLLLAQKGTNPNIQNSAAFTPLHMCTKKHDLEGVRLLLEYGARPDVKDKNGWTPLSIAYSEKQKQKQTEQPAEDENDRSLTSAEVDSEQLDDLEEIMHCLIESGADPNQLSFTSRTSPLYEACRLGMERRAEILIEHGADVNFVKPAKKIQAPGGDDASPEEGEGSSQMSQAWSVLAISVLKERSPHIISLLIEKGAHVNFTNAKGYTPLHTAVTLANYEVVRMLLEAGADPNICTVDGASPLFTALCVAFGSRANPGRSERAPRKSDRSASASLMPSLTSMAGGSSSSNNNSPSRRQAELIIEALLEHGARPSDEPLKLLKTALYGNSPSIFVSLLKPRASTDAADSSAARREGMQALEERPAELLNYLLYMRKRGNIHLEDLKELLSLFLDGHCHSRGADGEETTIKIPWRVDVNGTASGRTPVHDLVLSSIFAVVNASRQRQPVPEQALATEVELVAFLVSKGAALNQTDPRTGFTPLTSAVLALGLLKDAGEARYRDRLVGLVDSLLSLGATPSLTSVDKRGRTWLHHAAQSCPSDVLERLLALARKYVGDAQVSALVDAGDASRKTALQLALAGNQLATVSHLLRCGADANLCDRNGRSPLMLAFMAKDCTDAQLCELADKLVAHGANVKYQNGSYNVLDLAVLKQRWAVADHLVDLGAQFTPAGKLLSGKSSVLRWPVLNMVAHHGNHRLARLLLEAKSVDIDDMDRHMWTAIHVAVLRGDVEMTRLLLEHGADPSQNTNHAWSVLHTAAAFRRAKTPEDILKHKQRQQKRREEKREAKRKWDQEQKNRAAAAAAAAAEDIASRPRLSRRAFEEAERKRKEEEAELREEETRADAAAQGNEDVSEQLLRVLLENAGAAQKLSINGKDERGRTALDVAFLVGNIKGAKVLAAHGGRKHKFGFPDGKGWNDLHHAVSAGETHTVKDILKILAEPEFKHVIDINAGDHFGLTPLMVAAMKPNARVVKALLAHGANPALRDRNEKNCLHYALARKRRGAVKAIMKVAGDDVVLATNKEGYSCLDLASKQAGSKKTSLYDLVSKHGAHVKAAVEERPENRPEGWARRPARGQDAMVWSASKSGKGVRLAAGEVDWREWQDDFAREQEEYEAEQAEYDPSYGDGNGDDDHHGGYRNSSHYLDWAEYMPSAPMHGAVSFQADDPADLIHVPTTGHDGGDGEDTGSFSSGPSSFAYAPGYYAEPAVDDDNSDPLAAYGGADWDNSAWTGAASDAGSPYTADSWASPAMQPYAGDFMMMGQQQQQLPVVSCPFCGSVWPDSEGVVAHALAAHNAYLG